MNSMNAIIQFPNFLRDILHTVNRPIAIRRKPGVGVLMAARLFANDLGGPCRLPHHTVSVRGLLQELELAKDGLFIADDFQEFSEQAQQIIIDAAKGNKQKVIITIEDVVNPKQYIVPAQQVKLVENTISAIEPHFFTLDIHFLYSFFEKTI